MFRGKPAGFGALQSEGPRNNKEREGRMSKYNGMPHLSLKLRFLPPPFSTPTHYSSGTKVRYFFPLHLVAIHSGRSVSSLQMGSFPEPKWTQLLLLALCSFVLLPPAITISLKRVEHTSYYSEWMPYLLRLTCRQPRLWA